MKFHVYEDALLSPDLFLPFLSKTLTLRLPCPDLSFSTWSSPLFPMSVAFQKPQQAALETTPFSVWPLMANLWWLSPFDVVVTEGRRDTSYLLLPRACHGRAGISGSTTPSFVAFLVPPWATTSPYMNPLLLSVEAIKSDLKRPQKT